LKRESGGGWPWGTRRKGADTRKKKGSWGKKVRGHLNPKGGPIKKGDLKINVIIGGVKPRPAQYRLS